MAKTVKLGEPPIEVVIKTSTRARRLSLRISGVDGRVSLTMPDRAALHEAQSFLQEKEDWIRGHLSAQPEVVAVGLGVTIPVEGQGRQIVTGTGRAVHLDTDALAIPGRPEQAGARARAFLKTLARDRLAEASLRYAAQLGRPFSQITLRDTRSRWGSCSSDGKLMYSWRLILAPPEVLDYVAAHEVAHLAEMNHSPRYWAGLERLLPSYKAPQKWLRDNGAALHRFTF